MAADCRHYYHVDIAQLSSAEVVRLAEQLPHFWRINTDTKPVRVHSAVYAAVTAAQRAAQDDDPQLSTADELTARGIRITTVQ